jgi:hypothetical protein
MMTRSYCAFAAYALINFAAKNMKVFTFNTPARLYAYETLLERWPQDLHDMAAEFGEFIQKEHAIVG